MDLKAIEKNYERMSDDELIRIATTKADGLRPEVFGIIEKEINKRKLNPNLLKGAEAQNREYALEEIEAYSELLRILPCPICGSSKAKLNGTILYTVRSFIFVTSYKKEPIIACPDCLDNESKKSLISTALLGWWGFPWGLIKTPEYIYKNYIAKQGNRIEVASGALISFTLFNIGEIETYKTDAEKLREIIRKRKKMNEFPSLMVF